MKIQSMLEKGRYLGLGFLMMGLAMFAGPSLSHAEGPMVSGFADLIYTFMDETEIENERTFQLNAEVDIEKRWNGLTGRVDLNLPAAELEAQDLPGSSGPADIGIEQARFDWMVPGGEDFGLNITGGAFNSPIGFEGQDAPDLLQTSNGQLFALVPSNFLGVMFSGGMGPVSGSLIAANEWHGNTIAPNNRARNSLAAQVSLMPIEEANLTVSGILDPDKSAADTDDKDILNVVAQTTILPMTLLAAEYTMDKNNDAFAIVANVTHETEMPHFATVRFDYVKSDMGSDYASDTLGLTDCATNDCNFHTLTVAGGIEVVENLSTILEYKRSESEVEFPGGDDAEVFHGVTLEWVYTF